jgi:hypothetical protein
MTDHKSPLERALDVFVYAPVGLALTAVEELPGLIEKGRTRINNQVTMARVVGQFAATKGAEEAGKAVKQATDALAGLGVGPAARPPVRPVEQANGGGAASASSPAASGSAANGSADGHRPPAPPSDDLAIPGYDALSASQVVQRLDGLAAAELEAVREYETATRGRRTILSKIAQLQTERS